MRSHDVMISQNHMLGYVHVPLNIGGVTCVSEQKKFLAKTYMNQTVALCFEFTYLVVAFYFWYLQVTYGTCWTYRTCKLDLAHLQDNFPNYEHNLPKLDLATSQRYSK